MGILRLASYTPKTPYAFLWPWEKATVTAAELSLGWLAVHRLPALTWIFMGLSLMLMAAVYPHSGIILLAFPLARLAALDLTTHTLPDVYTIPLIALGLARAWHHDVFTDHLLAMGLVTGLFWLLQSTGRKTTTSAPAMGQTLGMGGGDIKLMLAMFAFLPTVQACFAIGLGCLLWLPFGFWRPKTAQPFGVPLVLGWVLMLALAGRVPAWLGG